MARLSVHLPCRGRRVAAIYVREYPPVDLVVTNFAPGQHAHVPRYSVDQGASLTLASYHWNSGFTMALWGASPKLGSQALLIPAVQYGFLLEVAGFIPLAGTSSSSGLSELKLTVPKNPKLGGLQAYVQVLVYNPASTGGALSEAAAIHIRK